MARRLSLRAAERDIRAVVLIGFGADSIVDGSASAVLVWRFSAERSHGDGMLSLAGAALAAATLVSLLLDSAVGWCADPVAALLIAGTLLREGCLILGTT